MREKKFKGQLNHAFYEILLVTLFIERPSYKDGMAVETVHVTIRDALHESSLYVLFMTLMKRT